MSEPRTWLITGCSTGIGRSIAEHVAGSGERLLATARNPDSVRDLASGREARVKALRLDVTKQDEVDAAIACAEADFGGLDILVNNAGYGYVSTIEEGNEAAVRAMFDVNLFGTLRMIQAALPGMRRRRRGLIVNISSLAGRIANPVTGFYGSSKHALEALTGALAREVEPFGIRVCAVAPGMFLSDFSGRSLASERPQIEDYADGAHERLALVKAVDGRQRGDPAKLAEAIFELARMDDPPRQLLLGPDAYQAVTQRLTEQLQEIERFRELSCSTDLESTQPRED